MEGKSCKKLSLPLWGHEPGPSSVKKPRTIIDKASKTEQVLVELKNPDEKITFQKNINDLDKLDKTLEHESNMLNKSCESLQIQYKDLQNIITIEKVPKSIIDRYKIRIKREDHFKTAVIDERNYTNELIRTSVVTRGTNKKIKSTLKKKKELISKIKKEQKLIEQFTEDVKRKIKRQETKHRSKIKRQTVNGDEFQRILQVLLRQRALSCPGAQVGIEVSGVGQLDDAVYSKTTENKCRFFQMKHMTRKLQYIPPITAKELFFKYEFEDEDTLNDGIIKNYDSEANRCQNTTQGEQKKESKEQSGLHLLNYFKSFCIIKESSHFENWNIEEVTLITNRSIIRTDRIKGQELMSLLVEKKGDTVIDECLDFEGEKAKKYGLNVIKAREHFFPFLLKESNKFLSKKKDTAEAIINEFLEKIHIVVNYPDLEDLRKRILNEVFNENIFCSLDRNMLGKCIFYTEIELLQVNNEFTTNEQWQSKINKIKKFVNGIKSVGLTNLKTQSVLSHKITFQNVNDIYTDVKLFIEGDKHRVLECMGDNFNMNSIKILHMLPTIFHENKKLKESKFLFCEYEHLLTAEFLQDSFCSGEYDLLVIMCKNFTIKEEELLAKLVEALKKSKMIIVSEGINSFTTSLKYSLKNNYLFKQYEHGYKHLAPSCKKTLCKKQINFQMRPIEFGKLVSDNLANNAVNDNCLWDIVNNSNSEITVSDDSSFFSHGYSTCYYIERKFIKTTYNETSGSFITSTTTLEEKNLMEGPSNDANRIVILVGDSGVGKSTTLTSIANKIRETYPSTWVARVILRQTFILNILKNTSKLVSPDDAISCVCKMIFINKPQNLLDKRLIKEALKCSYKGTFRFVLLLDGFNEINTDLQNKVISLTTILRDSCNVDQIWITTQVHEMVKLQTELKVSSYSLVSLNEEDQIKLMARYWQTQYENQDPTIENNYDELISDAKVAITEFKSCLNGIEQEMFTANSLNLRMLADVLIKDRKIKTKWKIFDLYETFVKLKFLVYRRETSLVHPALHDREREAEEGEMDNEESESIVTLKDTLFEHYIRGILQQFSVKNVLNNTKTDKGNKRELPGMDAYETFKTLSPSSESELTLSKLGILIIKNHDFDFIHPSFSQFFFCEYLIKHLFKCDNNLRELWVKFVLTKHSFQPCRRFLDHALYRLELEESNTKELEKLKNNLTSSLTNILIQKTRNSAAPIKENLYYLSLFLLRWLKAIDVKRYLRKILYQDLNPAHGILTNTVDTIISYFDTTPKEQSVNLLLSLYTKINKNENIQSFIQEMVKSEENSKSDDNSESEENIEPEEN